jgi:hypothetical protein
VRTRIESPRNQDRDILRVDIAVGQDLIGRHAGAGCGRGG